MADRVELALAKLTATVIGMFSSQPVDIVKLLPSWNMFGPKEATSEYMEPEEILSAFDKLIFEQERSGKVVRKN